MSTSIAKTKTGGFPVGVRRGWSDWQRDLPGFLSWLQKNRFGVVDFGPDVAAVKAAKDAGLRVGSADLDWNGLISPDAAVRKAAVDKNAANIVAMGEAYGPMNHFTVMLPADQSKSRAENFGYMVESYNALAPTLEKHNAKVVVEGWPGPGVLCCTPEGYAAFLKQCPSKAMGINYDPSHLLRMGIDPLRFVKEFASRVFHVHGKDTELMAEGLYQYGNLQPATFAKGRDFGEMCWRYTIPGRGGCDWTALLGVLAKEGYKGAVSIELEDADFNGTPEGEQKGLTSGRDFLEKS